jgi:CheY-like chemotaxis protein
MALRILAVDDEPEILRTIKSVVEPLGIEILTLSDSREALRRLRRERFDGFLLDSVMPAVDGFELTRAIRSATSSSSAPIVMLTALEDVETMRKAFRAGISIILTKPLSPERLAGLVRVLRGPMLTEKRRRARLPLRTVVECKLGDKSFKVESLNVGEGGMLIDSPLDLEVGQELELQFGVPGGASLLTPRGKIIRKEPGGRVAIYFVHFLAPDLAIMRAYIGAEVRD